MDPFLVAIALDNQPSSPHSPPQQRPSVAAASPAAPAPPPLNHHPTYAEMIYAAITALKKKDGSSKIAIGKYIEQSYLNLPENHSTLLTQHLQRLKNTGHLLMVKKSYKLPKCDAPVPETNNNNQDKAVNISSSAHGSKTSRGRGHPPKNLDAVKAQPVSVPVGVVDQTPHLTPAKRGRGRTRRPVGRPRKVPISYAFSEANAAVPVQVPVKNVGRRRGIGTVAAAAATAKVKPVGRPMGRPVGRPNPTKSKSRTGSVGRPRKDEVVSQRKSSENDVRCLREELQQVRDDRDRLDLRVQSLTAELDLKERQLTAANERLKLCDGNEKAMKRRKKYLMG